MTATVTAPPTAPPTPPTATVPSSRRRRLAALGLLLLLAAVLLLRSGGGSAHKPAPLDSAVRGTYQLDDGRHLTLLGSAQFPRYELDGQLTILMADSPNRYVAMDGGEGMTVQRDATGTVTNLALTTEAGSHTASPVTLHTEREIRFSSNDAELAGTLLVPRTGGPHPAVVIVHGAEVNADRENYRLLGSHFARRGVAAFVYDKRGVGASTGDFARATFEDLTADALAAVTAVAAESLIDPDRVGLLGFSQGAWVVAGAARSSDAVAFVAAYSASGLSPADQQAWLHGSMLAARGFDANGMVVADRVSRMLYSSLDLVDAGLMPRIPQVPGFWFHALDPYTDSAALWEGVGQPVLLAWGADDCQVPAHDSMRILGQALARGGNATVTSVVLPDADHSFTLVEPCGHETGLAHHGSMQFSPGYFDLGPDWITTLDTPGQATPAGPVASHPATDVLGWHVAPPQPAPWYGAIPAQLGALALLLGIFGIAVVQWVGSATRRFTTGQTLGWARQLVGIAGFTGLAATLTGFAAITEIAMLGDTHAAFLVGGPTVQGSSVLMTAARVLAPAAAVLGLTVLFTARAARRLRWAVPVAACLLTAWAAYWTLLPIR